MYLEQNFIDSWLAEDGIRENVFYEKLLPKESAQATIYIKEDLILAGLPFFVQVFNTLDANLLSFESLAAFEGKEFVKGDKIELPVKLPFRTLLSGERLALNLVQRASAIATYTGRMVEEAKKYNIKILDTRKTTPGLRSLEKYAVRTGGGHNHRFKQNDIWMIKDNHKTFFGGVEQALSFFKRCQSFYAPVVVEVHSLEELNQVLELKVKHIMLDNFSRQDIEKAVSLKPEGITYELSGGININNIETYLVQGVDAISSGALTHSVPSVDISLKYTKA